MKPIIQIAAITATTLALVGCASIPEAGSGVPDYTARPAYATVSLTAGFPDDPRVVALHAGGHIDAQVVGSSCRGFIAEAPDVRLYYDAGSLPLIISADSRADTTLVVNGPDGRWYCDDDGGVNGLNPSLRFNAPGSGQYDIWVGAYDGGVEPARLHISELDSQ